MATQAVEDYLKHLYMEQQRHEGSLVPTGRLATSLGVTPGTATSMVKTLARRGLVDHEPRRGVRLTRQGHRQAIDVIRRHRIIELFLVEILGMDWTEVHEEAEQMEHAVSEAVLEQMDALLGHPSHDPHGDPIPDASGKVVNSDLPSLDACEAGEGIRIERITDDGQAFLQFVDRTGLTPGTRARIVDRDDAAECLEVKLRGKAAITIGYPAARKILVTTD